MFQIVDISGVSSFNALVECTKYILCTISLCEIYFWTNPATINKAKITMDVTV
jgi:hypothetical protein